MENEIKNIEEEVSEVVVAKPATSNLTLKKFIGNFKKQVAQEISTSEVILFAAAFATLPLVDLVAKSFSSLGTATQALYVIIPLIAFGLGYWFSKDKARPVSSFLHSLTAISVLMASVALIPLIPGIEGILTGPGSLVVGMPILAIIFIFASSYIRNSGASYVFATIATIVIFFLSLAQLFMIPCSNAIMSEAANAQSICNATPYFQNIMIPVALFAIGFFAFGKKK